MITAAKGEDLSFIELNRRKLSTTNFDTTGAPYLESVMKLLCIPTRRLSTRRDREPREYCAWQGNLTHRHFQCGRVLTPDKRIFREYRSQTREEGHSS